MFAYTTDPHTFHTWRQCVIDGHLDQASPAQVGTRCLTTRRIGMASRTVTSQLTHRTALGCLKAPDLGNEDGVGEAANDQSGNWLAGSITACR